MTKTTPSGWDTGRVDAKRSIASRLAATRHSLPVVLRAALLAAATVGATALPQSASAAERLRLENGNSIEGAVVRQTPTRVRFRSKRGEFWVDKQDIAAIEFLGGERAEATLRASGARTQTSGTQPTATQTTGTQTTGAQGVRTRPGPTASDLSRPANLRQGRDARSAPDAEAQTTTVADLLRDMGAPRVAVRRAAAYRIVRSWPDSSTTLAAVLEHGSDEARTEAARLLSRPDIGDTLELARKRLTDSHPPVRKLALRAIAARGHESLESDALRLLDEDPDTAVRHEAARALARIGAEKTAGHVIAVYAGESRREQRRLYHGVLVALFGESHGANATKWWKAFDEVFTGQRMLVDPARRVTLDAALGKRK